MAEFGPELNEAVAEACRANAAEIGSVLSRALDQTCTIEVGQAQTIEFGQWPDAWAEGGLALTLAIEDRSAVLIMPRGSGLIPAWCEQPDATGKSKLETLALELGMNVLPEEFVPEDSRAAWVANLAEAINRTTGQSLAMVPWTVSFGEGVVEAAIVLPILSATAIFEPLETPDAQASTDQTPSSSAETNGASTSTASSSSPASPARATAAEVAEPSYETPHERLEHELHLLPPYVRSLLRVKVTVSVCLASTKTRLSRVVDMSPGTIIQFDKNCEAPLTVEVAGVEVANGEVVKIGDKFGLRVQAIELPPERFLTLPKRSA